MNLTPFWLAVTETANTFSPQRQPAAHGNPGAGFQRPRAKSDTVVGRIPAKANRARALYSVNPRAFSPDTVDALLFAYTDGRRARWVEALGFHLVDDVA
jgi:hypothetical protein